MKKIFILSILVMPVMANADNVGPAAASGTPVIATANAPYATVGTETDDTTHVVTASYVKEAYNDTIAAVNKVNADKQDKLKNGSNNHAISSNVVAGSDMSGYLSRMVPYVRDDNEFSATKSDIAQDFGVQNLDDALISAGVVFDGMHGMAVAKQDSLTNFESGEEMASDVISVNNLSGTSFTNINDYNTFRSNVVSQVGTQLDETLMSADGVITLIKTATDEMQNANNSKRISAVTTWGNDTPTKLQLSTVD